MNTKLLMFFVVFKNLMVLSSSKQRSSTVSKIVVIFHILTVPMFPMA